MAVLQSGVAQKTERTATKGCGNSMLENKRLDSDTVEEEPSLAKASKRLKQVEDKKRIEAQCDGHLLEDEKGQPHTVTQRQKKMAKDDAQRIAIEASRAAAWRSASDRKDNFF
jgi:hypothetical protein